METTKAGLRKQLKQERLATALEARQQNSALIKERLLGVIDWPKVATIHCFEPIDELGEVDVTGVAAGKQIFTSRLIEGEWQIVSLNGSHDAPQKFDAVIVPMLGFDSRLHRIGYGGGYYDRLLAKHPEAHKIGVCFDIGRLEQIPIEKHDIPMDVIVTETAIYTPDSTPKGV